MRLCQPDGKQRGLEAQRGTLRGRKLLPTLWHFRARRGAIRRSLRAQSLRLDRWQYPLCRQGGVNGVGPAPLSVSADAQDIKVEEVEVWRELRPGR
jgi:hypothetical protein